MQSTVTAKPIKEREYMKSILIILCTLVISALVSAGELIIVKGQSYGYMSGRLALLEEAKKDAIEKLPFQNAKQKSEWKEWGGACSPQAMHPKCYYTVYATFANPTESAPWFYTATGIGDGEGTDEDDLALALAKKNARTNARWACRSLIVEPTSNWKSWKDDVGYLFVSNSFQCLE